MNRKEILTRAAIHFGKSELIFIEEALNVTKTEKDAFRLCIQFENTKISNNLRGLIKQGLSDLLEDRNISSIDKLAMSSEVADAFLKKLLVFSSIFSPELPARDCYRVTISTL